MPPAMAQNLETRPTVSDLQEDNHWVNLARTHWLKKAKVRKVKQDVIKKQIWDPLEAEGFPLRSLLTLENLNILEKFVPLARHPFLGS
jgi:intron-binding protein aquarius